MAAEHRWIEAIETYRVGLQFCRGNKALLEGLEVVKKAKLVHSSEDGIFKYLFARVNSIGEFFHRTNTIIDSVLSQNNNETKEKDVIPSVMLLQKVVGEVVEVKI